jgi:hypothetical protein
MWLEDGCGGGHGYARRMKRFRTEMQIGRMWRSRGGLVGRPYFWYCGLGRVGEHEDPTQRAGFGGRICVRHITRQRFRARE